MSIRGPASRFLDPERSRFSRATLILLSVSAWINNLLAFLFWIGVQLNNLGVWSDANLFWFIVLLFFAPLFVGIVGIIWQILSIPLVLIAAAAYWLWAEAFVIVTGKGRQTASPSLGRAEARRATRQETLVSAELGSEPSRGVSSAEVKDVAEVLRELSQLHEEGILTDEEYEARRSRLVENL